MDLPAPETVDPQAALPSTVAYIAYHAAQRPDDLAIIASGQEITYVAFYRDIGKMVTALRGFGLEYGNTVGIEIPQRYLHLVTMQACEALGVASFSYIQDEMAASEDMPP